MLMQMEAVLNSGVVAVIFDISEQSDVWTQVGYCSVIVDLALFQLCNNPFFS